MYILLPYQLSPTQLSSISDNIFTPRVLRLLLTSRALIGARSCFCPCFFPLLCHFWAIALRPPDILFCYSVFPFARLGIIYTTAIALAFAFWTSYRRARLSFSLYIDRAHFLLIFGFSPTSKYNSYYPCHFLVVCSTLYVIGLLRAVFLIRYLWSSCCSSSRLVLHGSATRTPLILAPRACEKILQKEMSQI